MKEINLCPVCKAPMHYPLQPEGTDKQFCSPCVRDMGRMGIFNESIVIENDEVHEKRAKLLERLKNKMGKWANSEDGGIDG